MKYLISIGLLLAVGLNLYAQNCTPLQDTITVCGLEYDLKLRSNNGALEAICPSTTDHIAFSMTDSMVHITVTSCGVYELTHTYQNTVDNCTVEDFYVLQMDDPSNQSISIVSNLSVAYAPQPVHEGGEASCDDPDPSTVGIGGVSIPQINWEECNDFSSQTTIYTASVFAPNPATNCEVDSIQINIDTQSGMSNTSSCDGFQQSDFYDVAGVDFLDLVNSIGNTELNDWLSNTINVPATNCGLDIDPSTSIDTIVQQYTLDIPVRTGGNWSIIQNGVNTLLQDTTNLVINLDSNYYLFIEPGANHIGPDSLFFQLLYGDDVDDLDTIPTSQTLSLQWIEFWDTITVTTIDTIYNTTQYGCGGLSIAAQSWSVPGAPPSPFGPINVGFPNCDCPAPTPIEYFFGIVDCFNPCVFASNGDVFCGGGTYQVIITDEQTGCTSIEQYDIIEDFDIPFIDVFVSGNITCDNPCVTLEAISDPWFFYDWFTPSGNQMNGQVITVCEVGTYEVIVSSDNGCIGSQFVTVVEDNISPDIQIIGITELTCNNPCTTLFVEGIDPNANDYLGCTWSSNGGFSDNTFTEIEVCEAGVYTVEAQFVSGCVSVATIEVTEIFNAPFIETNIPAVITCDNPCVTIEAFTDAPPNCYWVDENGQFVGELMTAEVCLPGVYTVFVEGANGCQTQATVTVMENLIPPNITIIGGGTITCAESNISITAMIDTDPNCAWTGPGGFIGDGQTIEISNAGTYCVTATNLENGCTATDCIEINEDISAPFVEITGNDTFCEGEETQLTANGSNSNVTYEWNTGETTSTINVGYGGTCYVTLTDNNNGCTASAEIILIENQNPTPLIVGNTVICQGTSTMLTTSDNFTSYVWSTNETTSSIVVASTGTYTVTVSDATGCIGETQIDITVEDLPLLDVDKLLSIECNMEQVSPVVYSNTNNLLFEWTDGNGFFSNDINPVFDEIGTYDLAVTSLSGCTNYSSVEVIDNRQYPIISAVADTIDCNDGIVYVRGTSNIPNASFVWTGPDNYINFDSIALVSDAGIYLLTVTAPNACFDTVSVEVISDLQVINLAVSADTIDCIQTNISIQATQIENATYAWTGPNEFTSSDTNPNVNEAGVYDLEVNYSNNCSTTTSIEVIENIDIPDVFVPSATITCQMENLVLEPESTVSELTYTWTGSNGFTSTDSNPTIETEGIYNLEIQNINNGCTNSTSVVIDKIEPITASFNSESTCGDLAEGSINLNQISGGVAPYFIEWSAVNSTDFDLENLTIGDYFYEINDSGDCIEQGTIAVESAPTNRTVIQETMDICEGSTMLLNPMESYETTENTVIQWQNGGNGSSLMIDEAGIYQVSIQEDCDVFEHIYEVTEKEDHSNRIYIPNAFSPNGDGVNDEFLPQAHSQLTNYTLSVFDRWGNLLFQNAETDKGWNGMNGNSNELRTGVFIYHLRADVQNCEGDIVPMEKFGDVTLLK